MAKQLVVVEIPEGWELACDEMRAPKVGEFVLTFDGIVAGPAGRFDNWGNRVIVRRVWQWPEWLNAAWICLLEDGVTWVASEMQPRIVNGTVLFPAMANAQVLDKELFGFEPPPCKDYRQSLRCNPARLEDLEQQEF